MKRFHYLLLASLVALGFAACGDDDEATPPTGSTPGETPATGGTGGGTGGGTDAPGNPCSPNPCNLGEECIVDGDEAICRLLGNECPPADSCTGGQGFIGCGCVDPVADPDDYVFSDVLSYINRIFLPGPDDPACCFNLNPDEPGPDNALGGLLGLLAPLLGDDLDINGILEDTLIDDDIALLVEYRGLNADLSADGPLFGMSVWLAEYAGDDLEDFQASWLNGRLAGNGVFRVNRASFGPLGSQVQFNNATIENGTITAGPSLFELSIDLSGLSDSIDLDLDLEIESAILEAAVQTHANGIATGTEDFDGQTVGTGKLGGAVDIGLVAALVDDLARECDCGGIDTSRTVFRAEEVGGELIIECTQEPGEGCTGDDGLICEFLPTVCTTVPSILVGNDAIIDVDSTGSGVKNAISIGLRLGMTGAAIDADQPLTEE